MNYSNPPSVIAYLRMLFSDSPCRSCALPYLYCNQGMELSRYASMDHIFVADYVSFYP
jgi:hypothetical protein